MNDSFSNFIISWNTYFLNDVSEAWSHRWHRIDSSIAQFLNSLNSSNVYGLILSKLLIELIDIPRLSAAFYA